MKENEYNNINEIIIDNHKLLIDEMIGNENNNKNNVNNNILNNNNLISNQNEDKLIKKGDKFYEINKEINLRYSNELDIIKNSLSFLINFLNDKKENKEENSEEKRDSIFNRLSELKEIFLKTKEILEEIQLNEYYYYEGYKDYSVIRIFFDVYINISNKNILKIIKELFNIFKLSENLSKTIFKIIFQKISNEYYWYNNNNNDNFENLYKYLNLLIFLINGDKDNIYHLNNYLSNDTKKCEGIKVDLKKSIQIKAKNTFMIEIQFLIRNYNKNENSKLISITFPNNKIELILNITNIKLYINNNEKVLGNLNIVYDKFYKIKFSLLNLEKDKMIKIDLSELKNLNNEISKLIDFNEINLEINKIEFFQNFQGVFIPITFFMFEKERLQNNVNLFKNKYWNKLDKIQFNNQYENNIYLIRGIKILLTLFEKILLYKDNKEIFEKLLFLIKEILIDKSNNQINAYNDNFFEILSIFILNIDD